MGHGPAHTLTPVPTGREVHRLRVSGAAADYTEVGPVRVRYSLAAHGSGPADRYARRGPTQAKERLCRRVRQWLADSSPLSLP